MQLASSGRPNLTSVLHQCFYILISDMITVTFQTYIFNIELFLCEPLSNVIVLDGLSTHVHV